LTRFHTKSHAESQILKAKYTSHRRIPKLDKRLYTTLNLKKLYKEKEKKNPVPMVKNELTSSLKHKRNNSFSMKTMPRLTIYD
jgi:hypothetical protein